MSNVDGVVFVLKLVITLIKIQFYLPPNPPMTYKEKVKRIYSEIAEKEIEQYDVILNKPIHIGVVLNWMYTNVMFSDWENRILDLVDKRPHKNKGFSKPLPFEPDEEREIVIDFISSLLDGGK